MLGRIQFFSSMVFITLSIQYTYNKMTSAINNEANTTDEKNREAPRARGKNQTLSKQHLWGPNRKFQSNRVLNKGIS